MTRVHQGPRAHHSVEMSPEWWSRTGDALAQAIDNTGDVFFDSIKPWISVQAEKLV